MIFSRLLKDTTLLVLKVMTDDIMMEKISIQPPQVQFIVKQDVELLLFFCFCPRQINMADTIINKSLIYGTDLMYGFVKKEDSSGQSHSWEFHIAWGLCTYYVRTIGGRGGYPGVNRCERKGEGGSWPCEHSQAKITM